MEPGRIQSGVATQAETALMRLSTLAAAKINRGALAAVTAGKRRFGLVFWVRKAQVGRASRLLRAR